MYKEATVSNETIREIYVPILKKLKELEPKAKKRQEIKKKHIYEFQKKEEEYYDILKNSRFKDDPDVKFFQWTGYYYYSGSHLRECRINEDITRIKKVLNSLDVNQGFIVMTEDQISAMNRDKNDLVQSWEDWISAPIGAGKSHLKKYIDILANDSKSVNVVPTGESKSAPKEPEPCLTVHPPLRTITNVPVASKTDNVLAIILMVGILAIAGIAMFK